MEATAMERRMTDTPVKPYKGRGMEGFVASWYARQTAHDSAEFERTARRIADHLGPGSRLLEISLDPIGFELWLRK
jgi:hypothetical protein